MRVTPRARRASASADPDHPGSKGKAALAGAAGFEPANAGTQSWCRLHPGSAARSPKSVDFSGFFDSGRDSFEIRKKSAKNTVKFAERVGCDLWSAVEPAKHLHPLHPIAKFGRPVGAADL